MLDETYYRGNNLYPSRGMLINFRCPDFTSDLTEGSAQKMKSFQWPQYPHEKNNEKKTFSEKLIVGQTRGRLEKFLFCTWRQLC